MKKGVGQIKTKITWSIGGEAGFGIKVAGAMMARVLTRSGLHIFDYTEYPSLIRGGFNSYRMTIGKKEVRSVARGLDILVALNENAVKQEAKYLNDGGVIIYDPEAQKLSEAKYEKMGVSLLPVELKKIALDASGNELMKNTVALGASLGLLGIPFAKFQAILKFTFGRKGDDVVKANVKAARAGYKVAEKYVEDIDASFCLKLPSKPPKRIVVDGSQAAGLGAIAGGVNFYAGYPMTPSTPLFQYLAAKAEEHSIVVHQAEGEITAINAAIGASFTGARAMTGSAGGGFALMTEAVGLAAITETPLVVYVASRPGPATGLPTWTNQADLRFIMHAAQDEFPRVLF